MASMGQSANRTAGSYLAGCDTDLTGAGGAEPVCRAPEAASSGPLQSATVAAKAHRMPAAIGLPLSFGTGTTLAPEDVAKACPS